jgi:nickel/cobalt transporter (NiCoT) family protein
VRRLELIAERPPARLILRIADSVSEDEKRLVVATSCNTAADTRTLSETPLGDPMQTFARLLTTPSELRTRIVRVYAFLIGFNLVAWGLTIWASVSYPILLPAAFLAYTFGLRHAVDADHIAAIDNTTRKLMQDGQRPVGVGLFFSLGHSTVVVGLSILIALSAGIVSDIPTFREIGGLIGTTVSAVFLLVIGSINLLVLLDVYRMFRRVASGGAYSEESLEDYLNNRGLLARLFRPALRMIRKSWHMYPLGVLFGLGFDTASEVALLGLAATSGANHLPIALILLLPALFAAGMSLVDATDGVMMLGAYGWAYMKPIRKLYYNLNITLVSVLIAFGVGGIEILGIVADRLGLSGGVWDFVADLDFGIIGFGIVAIFGLSWAISTAIYRWRGYDDRPTVSSARTHGAS